MQIIEQEFKHAEKAEFMRLKDEEEMRVNSHTYNTKSLGWKFLLSQRRVQLKRHAALEKARSDEKLLKAKVLFLVMLFVGVRVTYIVIVGGSSD